jgi:hypothetical protein
MAELYIFVGFIVLAFLIIRKWNRMERNRTENFKAIASKLGMEFHAEGMDSVHKAHHHLRLFQRGREQKLRNLLRTHQDNTIVAVFDYQFTSGRGEKSRTHRQTVFSFSSSNLELPAFALRPENVFHKIGNIFGFTDINFESHPTFSSQYLLKGADEQAIRGFFTPDRIQYLESQKGICMEAEKNCLIYYRASRRVKADDLHTFITEGIEISKRFANL